MCVPGSFFVSVYSYVNLHHYNSNIFLRLAGLECEKISGQAKGAGYYPGCFDPDNLSDGPGAHAWNAVKLDGEWFVSDATWAAGSVGRSKD